MIYFILPAYNEEKNISILLRKLHGEMIQKGISYHVIVVDDGSTDATPEIIKSLQQKISVELCGYSPNQGVGVAFRLGFQRVLSICNDDDILVTMEADNTSNLNILYQMIMCVKEGCDLVLASPYAKGGYIKGVPFLRVLLSKGATFLLRFIFPIKGVHTYSSFYRAYQAQALRKLHEKYENKLIEEDGFESMVELLIKFGREKEIKITEVPMKLDWNKRVGKSKMRILKTSIGFLRVIFKEGKARVLGEERYIRRAT